MISNASQASIDALIRLFLEYVRLANRVEVPTTRPANRELARPASI